MELLFWIWTMLCMYSCSAKLTSQTIVFRIGPKQEECFYFPVNSGNIIHVVYHASAEDSQGHAPSISYKLSKVSGAVVASDQLKDQATYDLTADSAGDYKSCWENFSSYYGKRIYFSVYVTSEVQDVDGVWADVQSSDLQSEDTDSYNVKLEDLRSSLFEVRGKMHKVQLFQQLLLEAEAEDREVAEHNGERVLHWSLLQLAVMATVGVLQVIVVRALFDDRHSGKKSLLATLLK